MRIQYAKVMFSVLFCCVSGLASISNPQFCTAAVNMSDKTNRTLLEPHTAKCLERVLPLSQRFKMAQAVFAGRVVEINAQGESEVVKFRISKRWKNASRDELELYNAVDGEATPDYKIGETYIVFASGTDERLSTGNCSQGLVLPYAQAKSEIERLNRLARQRFTN